MRDFQGESNSVNSEIRETINNNSLQDKFILLNNGITVVAKHFKNLGSNDYEVREFQIVNGCQTSNIIFQNKETIKNSSTFLVPIKIIHTNNNELINRIIRATNRQTPVPEEAFVTLEIFHKRLQDFYIHQSKGLSEKIYYERRSKEYSNSDQRIEKARIINLHNQIRTFTSVFLAEPHLAYNNNPSEILRTRKNKLFQYGHEYFPYFLSSYLLFNFQKLIDEGKINHDNFIYRYYAIMVYRIVATKKLIIPHLNSNQIKKDCDYIINTLNDEEKKLSIFKQSIELINNTVNKERIQINTSIRDIIRTTQFKDSLFEALKSHLGKVF